MTKELFDKQLAKIKSKYGKISKSELADDHGDRGMQDRILLGFIWANKSERLNNFERLKEGNSSLFGIDSDKRGPATDDTHLLNIIGMWHDCDIYEVEIDKRIRPRSLKELIKKYNNQFPNDLKEDSEYERIKLKFRNRKNYLRQLNGERSVDINLLQTYALEEISEILSIFGIDFFHLE